VYPALAVLECLSNGQKSIQTLWVGRSDGMEADLVETAGVMFKSIPAAGIHGVGLRHLPGNLIQVMRGIGASRAILNNFKPDVMFFTGGYVAVPMATAGSRIPAVLYVPDIEPGLALKLLAFFADRIALTADDSKQFFSRRKKIVVTGYPVRSELTSWSKDDAYQCFGFSPDLPVLLVTGGSLGSLSINKALVAALPDLLEKMQIIHITGQLTWPQFSETRKTLRRSLIDRYQGFPYLHNEMGAAFRIADLVLSRAGASSIGEYPHFGIPAILVPYPHAWRYQKINADYLARNGAAIVLEDDELRLKLLPMVLKIIRNPDRLNHMKAAMRSLATKDAAQAIADQIIKVAESRILIRNKT
jgi:UDP-N-acetylglucosamine--N-acetylmuramyl-(pentapeptide) pyrophosphoryl-undecaprenol N-acetylglucosamine transferase